MGMQLFCLGDDVMDCARVGAVGMYIHFFVVPIANHKHCNDSMLLQLYDSLDFGTMY